MEEKNLKPLFVKREDLETYLDIVKAIKVKEDVINELLNQISILENEKEIVNIELHDRFEIDDPKETFKEMKGKYLKVTNPEDEKNVMYTKVESVEYTESIIPVFSDYKKEIIITGPTISKLEERDGKIKYQIGFKCIIDINQPTKYLITEITHTEFNTVEQECHIQH